MEVAVRMSATMRQQRGRLKKTQLVLGVVTVPKVKNVVLGNVW